MTGASKEIANKFGHRIRIRVCGILLNDDKVLMVKHKGIGSEGYFWIPPGGGMQFGENAHDTLKREVAEETGLEVEAGPFLFVHEFLGSPLHAIELFFRMNYLSGSLTVGVDPEMGEQQLIEEVKFLSLSEIRREGKGRVHQRFHDLKNLRDLHSYKGYFKFDKNSLK